MLSKKQRERLRKNVKNGAAWLDKHNPGWALKVDISRFEINDGAACVIGQVYGDYMEWIKCAESRDGAFLMTNTEACTRGFNITDKLFLSENGERANSLLNELWIDRIKRRQRAASKPSAQFYHD